MVPTADHIARPSIIRQGFGINPADAKPAKLQRHHFLGPAIGSPIDLIQPPVQHQAVLTQGVALLRQGDPARRIRGLFDIDIQDRAGHRPGGWAHGCKRAGFTSCGGAVERIRHGVPIVQNIAEVIPKMRGKGKV